MSAATWNILADQGATFSRVVTWKNSAGALVNLTGYTAMMQVRENYDSTSATLTLSTAAGTIVLGGAAGTITLTFPASGMVFDAGRYVHDLELTSASGAVTRLTMGSFVLRPQVTR